MLAVYLYQEVLQLLRKECCDVCVLQGERVEGAKYVLAYTSVDHPQAPTVDGVIRGQVCLTFFCFVVLCVLSDCFFTVRFN